jgi:putative membrane protein
VEFGLIGRRIFRRRRIVRRRRFFGELVMLISQDDRKRVANAIAAAERKTSGEIFCVVAQRSGSYRLVPVAWAAGLALFVPLPLIEFTDASVEAIYMIQLSVFILTSLALSRPGIRARVVPRLTRNERAHRSAMRQFLAQGLHNTKDRTGVLIFVSVAERYAAIIADEGINAKVEQSVWDAAMADLITAIKEKRAGDGLVAAVERCGAVLAQHFPPGLNNRNEIPNKLVEI